MKKQGVFDICNIYTAMWTVYYLQGAIYEKGSFISQFVLLILLTYSLYAFLRVHVKYLLPPFFRVMDVFLLIVSIYGIVDIFTLRGTAYSPISLWKDFLIAFLPIYAYYGFSKEGHINIGWLTSWFFIFCFSVAFSYFAERRLYYGGHVYIDSDGFTNNIGYRVVSLIPMVVFLRKNSIKFLSLLILLFFIILSMKRGAILVGGIAILAFLFRSFKGVKKGALGFIIIVTLFIVATYLLYNRFLSGNEFVNERIEQTLSGDMSGRESIYLFFWNHILEEPSLLRFLFGYGGMGTMRLLGVMAHNDWLELWIDMGLLGVLLYLLFWLSFVREITQRRQSRQCETCLIVLFIIMFGKTLFSMSYSDMPVYMTSVLGYSLSVGRRYTADNNE